MKLKVIGKLSKKKALKLHREMWMIVSRTPALPSILNVKDKAIKFLGYNPSSVYSSCFCCEYAKQQYHKLHPNTNDVDYRSMCDFCPINFSEDKDRHVKCYTEGSCYTQFIDNQYEEDRSWYAFQIAHLPEREVKEL